MKYVKNQFPLNLIFVSNESTQATDLIPWKRGDPTYRASGRMKVWKLAIRWHYQVDWIQQHTTIYFWLWTLQIEYFRVRTIEICALIVLVHVYKRFRWIYTNVWNTTNQANENQMIRKKLGWMRKWMEMTTTKIPSFKLCYTELNILLSVFLFGLCTSDVDMFGATELRVWAFAWARITKCLTHNRNREHDFKRTIEWHLSMSQQ